MLISSLRLHYAFEHLEDGKVRPSMNLWDTEKFYETLCHKVVFYAYAHYWSVLTHQEEYPQSSTSFCCCFRGWTLRCPSAPNTTM